MRTNSLLKFFFLIPCLALVLCIVKNKNPENLPDKKILTLSKNEIIDKINLRNKEIHSFSCYLTVTTGKMINLKGHLVYQKPHFLKLELHSMLGKELIIGSNNDIFWFWSKRYHSDNLYYSDYKNMMHSRLRTPFNPIWLRESLGFEEITYDSTTNKNNRLFVKNKCLSTENKEVIKITEIDCNRLTTIAQYILDMDNNTLATSEILDSVYENDFWIPKKIRFSWQEEDAVTDWKLYNIEINKHYSNFCLPTGYKYVDMTKD